MDVLQYNLDEIERWLLMLFRISAMFMAFPFFGLMAFPNQIKVALAVMVTVILFPLHPEVEMMYIPGVIAFFGYVLKEILVGIAAAMVGQFLFYGVQFAGFIVGRQVGFGIINTVDPLIDIQMPIISQIWNMLAIMLFIIIGGHHFLLMAIDECFLRIPVGGGTFSPFMVEGFARLSADIFIIGVKLCAPVFVAVLVTEFALGILARTVPQMNVWLVGFPLKIGIGVFTMGLSLPYFVYVFGKLYAGWQGDLIDFIRTMTG